MALLDLTGDVLLDDMLYGGLDGAEADDPEDNIEFGEDGGTLFSLQDETNIFIDTIDDNGVECEMLQHNVVRDDGVVVVHRYDRGQMITIKGWVKTTGSTTLFPYMDTVKKNLRWINGALYIKKAGWTYHRKHIATLVSFKQVFAAHQGWMIDWCPFTMQFFSKDYGKDLVYDYESVNLTVSPTNQVCENAGTADAELVSILVFDVANTVSAITITNVDTGEAVTLTTSIAAGSVVKFDGENKIVYLNSVVQNYTGAFPKLQVGNNTIRMTITATSFDATATLKWKNPYR